MKQKLKAIGIFVLAALMWGVIYTQGPIPYAMIKSIPIGLDHPLKSAPGCWECLTTEGLGPKCVQTCINEFFVYPDLSKPYIEACNY